MSHSHTHSLSLIVVHSPTHSLTHISPIHVLSLRYAGVMRCGTNEAGGDTDTGTYRDTGTLAD